MNVYPLIACAVCAASLLSTPAPAYAAPVPATGGYIYIDSQGCNVGGMPAPCFEGTDLAPYGAYQTLEFFGQRYSMYAGAAATANHVKADLDGTELGGRLIASFVDIYTLNGPGTGTLSFSAHLDVTGQRSPQAITGIGFGLLNLGGPGTRSAFTSGSSLFYAQASDPAVVDERLTLPLLDIAVGSSFSFATIVDLLVRTGHQANFGSTAVLGFSLPDGYWVSSQLGFSGPGSADPPVHDVPLPGSLALLLAGLAAAGVSARTRSSPRRCAAS